MKLNEALNCLQSLNALDGRPRVVRDGGQERVVIEPYTLSAPTRMAIARNIASLSAEEQAFNAARQSLIRQFCNADGEIPVEQRKDFESEIKSMLESETEAKLVLLSEADLQIGVNPIPPSVLASLLPVIGE